MSQGLGLAGCSLGLQIDYPWLEVARAKLARQYLTESTCARVFLRDDDVFPEVETVARMIKVLDFGAPCVVAPYCQRFDRDKWDVSFEPDGRFHSAGLGCALFERRVFEALWASYRRPLGFLQDGEELVHLYRDMLVDRDDGTQLYKEDEAFWFRVQECGFSPAVLEDVTVPHAGEARRYISKAGAPNP